MRATEAGESMLFVGGTDDERSAFEAARPILRCMACYALHLGHRGNGRRMKPFNYYIKVAAICALGDVMVAGLKWRLDPDRMIDALNLGTWVRFPMLGSFRQDAAVRLWVWVGDGDEGFGDCERKETFRGGLSIELGGGVCR